MYRKCATEISARHQQQVTEGLLELMQKTPYESITVTQLCQVSGVSRRVFYHLFSSKTDALHALIDHAILDSESHAPEIADQLVRFFRYWKGQGRLLDALLRNQLTGLFLERLIWIAANEDYDVRHWLRRESPQYGQHILVFTLSGILGLTFDWYLGGCRESPEEMAALLVRLLSGSPE